MFEYCCATCAWKGRGLTQEIDWLRIDGKEAPEWKDKDWIGFLNQMGKEKWQLVAVVSLERKDLGVYGINAFFLKHSI